MLMSFRWFGEHDEVTLRRVKQIPGVDGIVSALHDQRPGAVWPQSALNRLRDTVNAAGFRLAVIESIPVHEDIKLGRPSRDHLVDAWCTSLTRVAAIGVPVVCYNFMPVFDWLRTELYAPMNDGSTTMRYDDAALSGMDLSAGMTSLPAWADQYDGSTLATLRIAYREVSAEQLWENLAWFLGRVVPVAESVGVKLAIHPDDPPWPVFGVPRIVVDGAALERVTALVDSPANGITFCTGSLGADATNDLPVMISRLRGRIHFAHCRNVKRSGYRMFEESSHPSRYGDVDMRAVLVALRDSGFDGPMRPDHGRMIWDETGRPGYGLYDRALGAMYLQGLWEGITRARGEAEQ